MAIDERFSFKKLGRGRVARVFVFPLLCLLVALAGISEDSLANDFKKEGRLIFNIKEFPSPSKKAKFWRATYQAGGCRAEYDIFLYSEAESKGTAFVVHSGAFRRVPGSNGKVFLRDLAKALGAKRIIPDKASNVVTFEASYIGSHLTNIGNDIIAGDFSADRPGTWIVCKLFLGNGHAEVFLALNPSNGIGEFIMKSPECGESVVREVARLF